MSKRNSRSAKQARKLEPKKLSPTITWVLTTGIDREPVTVTKFANKLAAVQAFCETEPGMCRCCDEPGDAEPVLAVLNSDGYARTGILRSDGSRSWVDLRAVPVMACDEHLEFEGVV